MYFIELHLFLVFFVCLFFDDEVATTWRMRAPVSNTQGFADSVFVF